MNPKITHAVILFFFTWTTLLSPVMPSAYAEADFYYDPQNPGPVITFDTLEQQSQTGTLDSSNVITGSLDIFGTFLISPLSQAVSLPQETSFLTRISEGIYVMEFVAGIQQSSQVIE